MNSFYTCKHYIYKRGAAKSRKKISNTKKKSRRLNFPLLFVVVVSHRGPTEIITKKKLKFNLDIH